MKENPLKRPIVRREIAELRARQAQERAVAQGQLPPPPPPRLSFETGPMEQLPDEVLPGDSQDTRPADPEFDGQAKRLLRFIRLGDTLAKACQRDGMPDKLTVYDWLRDNARTLLDGTVFSLAYHEACIDRALTWQDDAAAAFDEVKLVGDRSDAVRLKHASDRASFLLRMSKAQREALGQHVSSKPQAPVVVLRRFVTQAPELFESLLPETPYSRDDPEETQP